MKSDKKKLQGFENYGVTSNNYDASRVAVGLEIILGSQTVSSVPLSKQILLDAGCGTGNYLVALAPFFKELYGLEFNEGMLKQAVKKSKDHKNITTVQGNLAKKLPYEDNMFHCVIVNMVIHHFQEQDKEGRFPIIEKLFKNIHRVLKPGGRFILSTCSHKQLRDGIWWTDLIPHACSKAILRFADTNPLKVMLSEAGFSNKGVFVPLHSVLQGRHYWDMEGPLQEKWRQGDSTWALCSENELNSALQLLAQKKSDGTLSAYFQQRDALRFDIGQTTFLCAEK